MSNKIYDFLKYLAIIGLPAVSAFYMSIAQIWGLPNGPEVAATITAAQVCLGALLCANTTEYQRNSKYVLQDALDSAKEVLAEYQKGDSLHDERAADLY